MTDQQIVNIGKSLGLMPIVRREEAYADLPGWKSLLERIFSALEKYNETTPEKVWPVQIKEKFGGLRFYLNDGIDPWSLLALTIERAEKVSYSICEICGDQGYTKTFNYWVRTLCETHHEERENK